MNNRAWLALLLAFAASSALAQAGKIHPDPAKPRPGFKPHQISFETPQDGVARDEFRSAPFYAVILKTAARCSVKEPACVVLTHTFCWLVGPQKNAPAVLPWRLQM